MATSRSRVSCTQAEAMWKWLARWSMRSRRKVLQALADVPGRTGADIMEATGLGSGSVYPVLIVAEERGAVCSQWGSAARPGGPRPRYYWLTQWGQRELTLLSQPPKDIACDN